MKLTVLVDNNTFIGRYFFGEPGLSYFIEVDGIRVLFDTGYSDIFIKNSKMMGIELGSLDFIVLSHGHDDHSNGLKYFLDEFNYEKKKLITHPHAVKAKFQKNEAVGSLLSEKEILTSFCCLLTKEPYEISTNLIYLGEIPKSNDFEDRPSTGTMVENKELIEDNLLDDSALVYKGKGGIFIITGCSHSGICNIIEYAMKVCNTKKVAGVIGGFHLFDNDDRLNKTIKYFKDRNMKYIYPAHCVSLKAKCKMAALLNIKEVGVGLELNI